MPALHARTKAIMRCRSVHKNNVLTFKDITADLESMECRVHSKALLYFINNKGRMLTRQAMAAHL